MKLSVPCITAGIEDVEGKHKWDTDVIMINKQEVLILYHKVILSLKNFTLTA